MYRLGSLAPLDRYLAYLTTFPDPNDACVALMRGPLSPLGAKSGSIWARYSDEEIRIIGSYQSSADVVQRYSSIPLDLDLPVSQCVMTGEMLVHELNSITSTFPALALDSSIWKAISDRSQGTYLVSQPIIAAGMTLGAIGFVSSQTRGFIESFAPMLSSISSAVALWLTHPQTKQSVSTVGLAVQPSASLGLTPRQQQILLLVEDGRSNAAIAHLMGYSLSTVKQELQRVLFSLRVHGRREAVQRARELGLIAQSDAESEQTGT
jgi:DNA-binding NarL/FixJ family response regulator